MVERISTLLHDEATDVAVPAPPTAAILRKGHRRWRRRRLTEGLAVATTVGAVVAVAMTVVPSSSRGPDVRETFQAASASAAYEDDGAFSIGSTVYVGNHAVRFDEKVKAMYDTSVGVLVRMGAKAATDTGGPSHYVLVAPDGSTRAIALEMGDRVPGTDPASPYVAYAAPDGDRWDLVALDLRTGHEAARTTVEGSFTWGGWEAPPVTTAGERMWALFDDGWREFDWATGQTRMIPDTAHAQLNAAGGRYADPSESNWDPGSARKGHWTVHDFATNAVVREITLEPGELGGFSPDGRYVRVDAGPTMYDESGHVTDPPGPSRFVNVETGRSVQVPGDRVLGWTPTGDAIAVDTTKDQLTVCDTDTGGCRVIGLRLPDGKVKLGGLPYES
jgi:hypothetical protein